MPNPEYPIYISLPEKPTMMRSSIGNGSEIISPTLAGELLSDAIISQTLETHIRISQSPEIFNHFSLRIGHRTSKEDIVLPSDPPTIKAAKYINDVAKQMKEGAVDAALIIMRTQNVRNVLGFTAFYDIATGMELVPSLVDAIEGMKKYDAIEGIPDRIAKAFLIKYHEDPPAVIGDLVAIHVSRYARGDKEVGIYVPEFVARGATHAQTLFANIYNGLTE